MITIEQAVTLQGSYRAHEKYREPLQETTIIAAVGATAVGKNFLMEKSGLPVVGTLTTREPRESDDPTRYRYIELADVLDKIERGEVVQYGTYPPHIYASELQDYALGEPKISDICFSAVNDLGNKGFKSVQAFSTLTSKEQWMSQLMERFEGMTVGAIHARLTEARRSLRWTRAEALGARAANHLVIINTVDTVEENVERIREFANGKYVPQPDDETVRSYAEGMEQAIDLIYGRLKI